MGGRANVFVKGGSDIEGGVYLYTHWSGHRLPTTVQNALLRKQRWGNNTYLARIIFSEMIRKEIDEDTGFGISTHITDNEYPIIVVNCDNLTIGFAQPRYDSDPVPDEHAKWTFDEYILLSPESLTEGFESVSSR